MAHIILLLNATRAVDTELSVSTCTLSYPKRHVRIWYLRVPLLAREELRCLNGTGEY